MKESQLLWEILSGPMPMGVALVDEGRRLRRCNATWADYIARSTPLSQREVVPGRYLFDLLPGTERLLAPLLARAFAGETVRRETLHLRSADVDTYWDLVLAPQETEGGEVAVLLVASDVTDRVQAQQSAEQQVADRTRRLSALYQVMEVASEPLDLPEMLSRLLAQVLTAVRSQAGAIHLLSKDGTSLQLAVKQKLVDEVAPSAEFAVEESGLPGEVLAGEDTLIVRNLQSDPRAALTRFQPELRTYAGTPLRARRHLIGVLSVFRSSSRPFLAEDIALLGSVADQIGIAVENRRLRQQAEQLAVVEERARLARELHDAVTQSLYSVSLLAAAGRRLARSAETENVELLQATLAELEDTAQQALKEMRLLLYRLRPSALQRHNLVSALRQRLEAVEKRAGVRATLDVTGLEQVSPALEETLYHIAQEALNNALKHAYATSVAVALRKEDGQVVLEVSDNGQGFDPRAADKSGMGLATMRERAQSWNGTFAIEASPGQGTRVIACLPTAVEQS